MTILRFTFFFLFFIIQTINPLFSQKDTLIYPWKKSSPITETMLSHFPTPEGFTRVPVADNSFAQWLRRLPVLPGNSPVVDYREQIRKSSSDSTIAAVIDYPVRGKKLEQCMDIIQRFYAEYLWSQNRANELTFFLPGSFPLKWDDWKNGYRPQYHGIKVSMIKSCRADSSRETFETYLWEIFYRSGTQTCYFAYPKIDNQEVQIGDFVVKKGKRGHAVLIVDMAVDSSGNKIALIGHGDTPACSFHLLNFGEDNAWFPLNKGEKYLPLPIRKKMYWEGLRRF